MGLMMGILGIPVLRFYPPDLSAAVSAWMACFLASEIITASYSNNLLLGENNLRCPLMLASPDPAVHDISHQLGDYRVYYCAQFDHPSPDSSVSSLAGLPSHLPDLSASLAVCFWACEVERGRSSDELHGACQRLVQGRCMRSF